MSSPAPPQSYATADEARAYVARVLSRRPPSSPRPVYLIAAPDLRASPAWAKVLPAVRANLPGAEVLEYRDVFTTGAPSTDARIAYLAEHVGGALVIPRAWHAEGAEVRHLLGYAARAEALGLLAAALPVLVLTPDGVVAWPDVRVRPAEGAPRTLPLELELPAPPTDALLPTVAASYRALGLPRPRPRRARRPREARPV